ncbi:DUF2784 domain-containing protein [Actinosynnema sp. NPDC047251]|uniref:Uncharacterized protein n=1 Tax=Saccharothrix espanaensis (strain ATCC 51144 / DSM 44229 / JCM 9112 / NBRC 15066 / NRRL 15764) TaxID=1179773 RepID=K0K5I8_SACES|nr:DUF2784 domain-containing protein [Saccharothrix espanaensis]CCH35540.1 hypothetical protein BN6_83230 [Saccharothrix espanaensis DSM 44229]
MVALALAELVMVLHFGVLLFLLVGGFLAWHRPRLIYPHLAMAAWGVLIVAFPLDCPLTWLENTFRTAAGQPALVDGFIDTYLDGVLYPESAAGTVQLLVALAVVGSWVGYLLKRRAEQTCNSVQFTNRR